MNNEQIFEYLSDIGVLLFDNINLFLQIHSSNNNKYFKNEAEKLKESLFLYLQKTTKNDNLLHLMSNRLIESYYNSQAISKYKSLKNMVNILQNKYFIIYHDFIINLSKFIINKNENYNKKAKSKSKPKKRTQRPKKTNQYNNNFYKNIQDNNTNSYSYFVNNNKDSYLNMYNNDFIIEKPNISNNDLNNNINDDNIISYKYYSPMVNIQSKKPMNNYIPINNNKNDINQNQLILNNDINDDINNDINNNTNNKKIMNNINNIQNYNNYNMLNNNENLSIQPEYENRISPQDDININDINNNNYDYIPDDYDFYDNEQKHLEKVKNKIMNLKNERITKLEEQCTFTPQINNTYNIPKSEKNINTFEKLYHDSSINKIKKEQRIKQYLEQFKFAPSLEINNKYKINSSFEKRRLKSIEVKQKYKENAQKEEKKRIKEA